MRKISNHARFLLAAALLAVAVPASRAADDPTDSAEESEYLPWDKGSIGFGGFVTFFDSTVSFGLASRPGVTINAEDRLGLDSTLTVFRAQAMYRPGKTRRNQFDFYYAAFDRTGSATLSKEITIRDVTYSVGAKIDTLLNFDLIRGSYSYAFVQNERLRLALGLGVYAVPLKYGLTIETSSGRSVVEGADTTLPLPALGLRAEWQIIPRLFLNGAIDGMYLQINDFKGSMVDLSLGLEYRPWKHFGVGAGYAFTGVSVEAAGGSSDYPGANFIGSVDVRFSGLLVYGKLSF